jgi:agmatine/peptidylarginine deiminase
MNRILLLLATSALLGGASAQLPHLLAPHERPLIPAYRDSRAGSDRGITTPPTEPVRTMAEWEEIQSLVICWAQYDGILKQIVAAAKDECEVIIVCADQNDVISFLQGSSFGGPLPDLDNITFVQAPFNSVWMRDYGAESIYTNEVDSLYMLDWIYNRPRPQDDAVPEVIGTTKGIGVYSTTEAPNDLVHTGGNFMSDGAGTAFSSELVLEDNGPNGEYNQTVKNEAQIDAIMQAWMGISNYIKMTALPYDGINHIDMHMKLLDEETLLVGEFPTGVSDGPQLETNIDGIMANEVSAFGEPYQLIRIPMPSSSGGAYPPSASYRTYTNSVFVNGTLIVPTYRTEFDTTGLRILQESLPGYRVVGIDCDNSGMNIISASGAIHCITKGIGVSDQLLIRHQRLRDTYDTQNPYAVDAYIRHKSGIANATLYWTTDTAQAWNTVAMADQGGNTWSAAIPAQPALTTLYYYVQATANSGKVQVRPIVAPEGWWRFHVLDMSSGLDAIAGPSILDIFPNPCENHVLLTLDGTLRERVAVRVADMAGRVVRTLYTGTVPADGRLLIDTSALPTGMYAITVSSRSGEYTARLVKR